MRRRTLHIPVFRIFYSSTYSILLLILFVLLSATPGDHIYQTISNHKLGNVFVVAGVYLVTALIAIFIYASRLYTNRVALAAIPRWYMPIQPGEVSKGVYRLISANRQRSALIAWDTKPRDLNVEPGFSHESSTNNPTDHTTALANSYSSSNNHIQDAKQAQHTTASNHLPHPNIFTHQPNNNGSEAQKLSKHPPTVLPVSASAPPWGVLSHPGWSSPSSADLPNLHFDTVVRELPNLLEAKAVSLAPPDPTLSFLQHHNTNSTAPKPAQPLGAIPDNAAIALLQRSPPMSLRAYLSYLAELGVIPDHHADTVASFLDLYEFARFSACALTEPEFRELMRLFSETLVALANPPDGFDAAALPATAATPEQGQDQDAHDAGESGEEHADWLDGGVGLGLGSLSDGVNHTADPPNRLQRELSTVTSLSSTGSVVLS